MAARVPRPLPRRSLERRDEIRVRIRRHRSGTPESRDKNAVFFCKVWHPPILDLKAEKSTTVKNNFKIIWAL